MNSSVWVVWAAQAVRKKKVDFSFSEQLLSVVLSTFYGQKKLNFFKRHCSVGTKKLHKIKLEFKKKILKN